MHIKTNLGEIVKQARTDKGLTQEQLAVIAGVGWRHISGIENEGNHPGFEVLYKIVRELNINIESVFFPEKFSGDTKLEYLMRILGICSERDILAITALVEVMTKNKELLLIQRIAES